MHSTYHQGDPYTTVYYPSEISPPNGTAPKIKITSPANNTLVTSNTTLLSFDLTLNALNSHQPLTLQALCYSLSWQLANTTVEIGAQNPTVSKTLSFTVNLTGVPEGNHSITVYAVAMSEFQTGSEEVQRPISQSGFIIGKYLNIYSNYYFTAGSSTINFTMDTVKPTPNMPNDVFHSTTLPYVLATALGIAVFFVGILLYLKKYQLRK